MATAGKTSAEITREINQALRAWRSRTLSIMWIAIAIISLPALIVVIAQTAVTGGNWTAVILYAIMYVLVVVLAAWRKLDMRFRGWGLIVVAYAVGTLGLLRGGLAGAGREYMMVIAMLSTILVGIRAGLVTAVVGLVTMGLFAVLADAGVLGSTLIYTENPVLIGAWTVELTYTFVLMVLMLLLAVYFIRFQITTLEAERMASHRLEVINLTLEEKVEERTRQLAEAVEEAQKANQLKSEFLATMSHELRTPLNAIIGYGQIMLDGMAGDLTDQQRGTQERILTNAESLLNLINDILDLSKIEADRLQLVERDFLLADWLTSVVFQVDPQADKKGLILKSSLDPALPTRMHGDTDRIKQIALNLLSNAIKFTEKGEVAISLRRAGEHSWVIEVSDTGIGIPPHAQEYIFERFRQVDSTSQRKYGGTGLGLAIARSLAQQMGGTIQLKSAVGEGSTFTVTLPIKPLEGPQ
nr:hypothetical protein [Anaerolineae bacterium]